MPETDARWKELYRVGNSRISKSEAAQLPNKTIAAVAGEDDYLVVISVFHDLHCLVIVFFFSFEYTLSGVLLSRNPTLSTLMALVC
jgi:hypothetical protein